MKVLFILGVLAVSYMYVLSHTTDMVLRQTSRLQSVYQRVTEADPQWLATGRRAN